MAINFARVENVRRSQGQNAVHLAAYLRRDRLLDPRTGLWSRDFSNIPTRALHLESLIPDGASRRFEDVLMLSGTMELSERRRDAVTAYHVVTALPAQVSDAQRLDIARQFAMDMFVAHGLGAYLAVHPAHEGERNWHAHYLVTTRAIEDAHLSKRKAAVPHLTPQIRQVAGRPAFASVRENWPKMWTDFQEEYFRRHHLAVAVDPPHAESLEHIDARKQHWHPLDPKLHRNLAKQRANLEARARLDQNEHGVELTWRDIARILEPQYAALAAKANEMRAAIHQAEGALTIDRRRLTRAETMIEQRQDEIGRARTLLHRVQRKRERRGQVRHGTDFELRRWEDEKARAEYLLSQRHAIRRTHPSDRLKALQQQGRQLLQVLRPRAIRELANRKRLAEDARQKLAAESIDSLIEVQREVQQPRQRPRMRS